MNRDVLPRLQRAATEIEAQARSRARHPSQLARMTLGQGLNWPFNGADLMHVLKRNRLVVFAADGHRCKATDLLGFAREIARMPIEGERFQRGGLVQEYEPDGNDQEIDALYQLIRQAREITGETPDGLVVD